MFNLGGGELIVIAMIALVVLGPARLPGAAKQIGKALAEFRRMSSGVQDDLREAMNAEGMRETVSHFRDALDVPRAIRSEVASAISSVGTTNLSGRSGGFDKPQSPRPGAAAEVGRTMFELSVPSPDGVFHDDLPTPMVGIDVPPPGASSADGPHRPS